VKIPYKSIAGTAASAPMHSKQGWGWRSLCQLEEALQQASMWAGSVASGRKL